MKNESTTKMLRSSIDRETCTCVKFRIIREDTYFGIENLPIYERMAKILTEGKDVNIESLFVYLSRTDSIKRI